jgi:hypothetical protein
MEQELFHQMIGLAAGEKSAAARAADFMARKLGLEEAHNRLIRYEASIRRAYHQAVTQLRTAQNNRKRDTDAKRQLLERAKDAAIAEVRAEIFDIDRVPTLYPVENESCDSNPISPAVASAIA